MKCELSLVLNDNESIEEKLNELGITKFELFEIECKGKTRVDLKALEMLK